LSNSVQPPPTSLYSPPVPPPLPSLNLPPIPPPGLK